MGPYGEPIEIPSTWWYMLSLRLKETDLIANTINSTKTLSGKEGTDVNGLRYCAVNHNDECFGILHRARTKQHLVVLQALYLLLYRPTLCKQNPKHSLNLLGDNWCLTHGGFWIFFPPPWSCYHSHFHPLLINLIYLHCFIRLLML